MRYNSLLAALAVSTATASPLLPRANCPLPSKAQLTVVDNAIYAAKLVPDLISAFSGSLLINAAFGTNTVNLGNTLTVTDTLPPPTFNITAEANYPASTTKYTVLLLDPDVPSPLLPVDRDTLGDYTHLIVSDVQPSCITSQTQVPLTTFKPLTPLSVAQHRYTFLVYRQPADFSPNLILAQDFLGLPLSTFLASSGLEGPVGGNYFLEGLANP